MGAMVSVKDLDRIEEPKEQRKKGLLAAIGAWEEFDDLEETVVDIYKRRGKAKERGIGRFDCRYGEHKSLFKNPRVKNGRLDTWKERGLIEEKLLMNICLG